MKRNIHLLSETAFDVCVIGGGINGAAIAWHLAAQGLKTCLVERSDFGSGSSQGCFRIAHGGLRYLQHLNLPRLLESAEEQRRLRLIAPHMLTPFPFLVPCYGFGLQGREILDLAVGVYEKLTFQRNRDVPPELHLPNHRILTATETLNSAPGISQHRLRGGLVYYDCQMASSDRLTLSVVQAAVARQAVAVNYCAVTQVQRTQEGQIESITCRDELGAANVVIRAKMFVNATGPHTKVTAKLLGAPEPAQRTLSKGVQLVFSKLSPKVAVAVESSAVDEAAVVRRGSKSYFLVPWNDRTLAGTFDSRFDGDPASYSITAEEIRAFLRDLSKAYADPLLNDRNLLSAFGGLRAVDPKEDTTEGTPPVARREFISEHARMGGPSNLISVEGVKYTTFFKLAERVAQKVCTSLGKLHEAPPQERLPGGDLDSPIEYTADVAREFALPHTDAQHVVRMYGSSARDLLSKETDFGRVLPDRQTLKAELRYSAQHEMVGHLNDLVFRRTVLAAMGDLSSEQLLSIAEEVAPILNWSSERIQAEIKRTEAELQQNFPLRKNAQTR